MSKLQLSIHKANLEDIPSLNKLVNSAYRGESSKKGWTTEADLLDGVRTTEASLTELLSDRNSNVLLAKDADGNLFGCVNLQLKGDGLYLGMLTVDPELQGGGIGKFLLTEADLFAKKNQKSFIEMTVISIRSELIAWYERHGYAKTGEKRPFPMDNPAFGVPKQFLEFIVLKKSIIS